MQVGDQVEIKELRQYEPHTLSYMPYTGEIVDIRGRVFKRYTVAYLVRDPVHFVITTKLCILRRGHFSPLYDAPLTDSGFKYE